MRTSGIQLFLFCGAVAVMVIMVSYTQLSALQDIRKQCGSVQSTIRDVIKETVQEEIRGWEAREKRKDEQKEKIYLPTIYIITPTYSRLEQIPELTRLAQTLMNVPHLHWLVADDAKTPNKAVVDYLAKTGLPHSYLNTPMPEIYKKNKAKPKGVANRNAGMDWVRQHATEGVIYFADDDNTYDIQIFEEMRYTEKVSMWPVGLVTNAGLSTPVVSEGQFKGWYDGWIGGRKFPVDMAGFAVSVKFLKQMSDAKMPFVPGYEEDGFLKSLKIKPQEIEFKADGCTKVYVWHTQTKKNNPSKRTILDAKYDNTNLRVIQKSMKLEEPPS